MKNWKPAQPVHNVGHKTSWTKARVLQAESNNACRTQSEQGHVSLCDTSGKWNLLRLAPAYS